MVQEAGSELCCELIAQRPAIQFRIHPILCLELSQDEHTRCTDLLKLLENQSSSLITSHAVQLPECGYYNDEGDEQSTVDYQLCPAVTQDASLCSMGSASAVGQSDDWCGECIRRRPERLFMSLAVDSGAIIVSELGTSVPWHIEDNCRSDAFIAIKPVD